jgi:nucleoid DNA-binding protein
MSNNLTKRDIVLKIFTDKGYPQKHIRDSVQMTLDAISEALLAGRDVELRNFGVFQVQVRKSRIGRNPNRPETDVVILRWPKSRRPSRRPSTKPCAI